MTTPNARVILPADATVEMIAAFWRQKNTGTQDIGEAGDATSDFDAYTAMLTAAPASGKVTEAELENVAITLFDLSWFIDDAPASENGERIGNTTWTTFESGVASALADPDKYLVGARMRFHDLLSEQERKRWMMLARAAISALGMTVEA